MIVNVAFVLMSIYYSYMNFDINIFIQLSIVLYLYLIFHSTLNLERIQRTLERRWCVTISRRRVVRRFRISLSLVCFLGHISVHVRNKQVYKSFKLDLSPSNLKIMFNISKITVWLSFYSRAIHLKNTIRVRLRPLDKCSDAWPRSGV